MVFKLVGDGLKQDCAIGMRDELEKIRKGELPKGEFSQVRGQVADTMDKYLSVLCTETPGFIPDWYPPETLKGPIKAVRKHVPDGAALIGETDRFLIALGNLMRPGEGDTIH